MQHCTRYKIFLYLRRRGGYGHLIGTVQPAYSSFIEKPVPGPVHDLQVKVGGVHSPQGSGQVSARIDGAESGPVRDFRVLSKCILIYGGLLDSLRVSDTAGDKAAGPMGAGIPAQQNVGKSDGHLSSHAHQRPVRLVKGAVKPVVLSIPPVGVERHILQQLPDHIDLTAATKRRSSRMAPF